MNTLDAITTRQSIGKVKPDPVPREIVEKLLSAAAQAPNHYKVRPWRFVVLIEAARDRLGEVMAESFIEKFPNLPPDAQAKAMEKERSKPLRSPLLIAVGVDKPAESKVIEIENVCVLPQLPARTYCSLRMTWDWLPGGGLVIRPLTRRSKNSWALSRISI